MPLEPQCHLTWEGTGRFHHFVVVAWHPLLCAFLYGFQQRNVANFSWKEVLIL